MQHLCALYECGNHSRLYAASRSIWGCARVHAVVGIRGAWHHAKSCGSASVWSDRPADQPMPDTLPHHTGRKTRYTYAAAVEKHGDGQEETVGLVKYDLASSDKAVAAMLHFGKGRIGGEAVFVPSSTKAAELKSKN